ncbi:MAG: hypothetical protein ACI4HQ_01725 [Acetatifactor sp.]
MRKRLLAVLLGFTMAAALLASCSGSAESTDEDGTVSEEKVESRNPSGQESKDSDRKDNKDDKENKDDKDSDHKESGSFDVSEATEARDAYMEFLNGTRSLVTAPGFGEDDGEYNYDGVYYGEYTYPELKVAIEKYEGYDTLTKYAFTDFGKDGTEELVVRFETSGHSFLNWVGIIHYDGEGLELVYSYEDGYRTVSALYESGYLAIGGSWGAGANGMDYMKFNEKGEASILFSCNHFYSSFATQIAYDLTDDDNVIEIYGEYNSLLNEDSTVEVTEYIPVERDGKGVKISVSNYSRDSEIRAIEERMINELVSMGAELISEEEMEKLCSAEEIQGTEVQWIDWEEKCTIVKATKKDYFYGEPKAYLYSVCSDGEYSMEVVVSTNKRITDVHVLSLMAEDIDEDNRMVYSGTDVDIFEELTPDTSLVITLEFMGDMPNYGISYVDEKGDRQLKTIQLSGYDGSIFLEDAKMRD